jgi:uncharacterized protein (TIGR00369 family)
MSDLSNLSIKFNSPHKDVEEFYNNSIQLKYYNCEVEFISDNLLLVKIPTITSIHQGGVGANAVNGGVISYLFDLALGMTSYLVKENQYVFSVTSRINIHFKKPLFAESVYAFAKIKEVKKNLIYSNSWIESETGVICAKADGVLFTK